MVADFEEKVEASDGAMDRYWQILEVQPNNIIRAQQPGRLRARRRAWRRGIGPFFHTLGWAEHLPNNHEVAADIFRVAPAVAEIRLHAAIAQRGGGGYRELCGDTGENTSAADELGIK